ncbi:MAG: hypothetical protein ACKV2T_15435 [Kofleriaceae bacterium]
MVVATTAAFAQGSGGSGAAAGSGAPTAGSGVPAAGSGAPAAGSGAPAADPASAQAPPTIDVSARRKICEDAVAKPPGGDARFVTDVQSLALGQVAAPQLAKSAEGQACVDAVTALDDFRSSMTSAANVKAAEQLAAEVKLQHENAAKAIAKDRKHVVMAYAAMWILAVGFLLFLWRRQQALKAEIANLKRDLEAATK